MTSVAGMTAYSFDAAGRKIRIDSSAGTQTIGYCEWNGLLAAVTNANGFVVEYSYDIMDRVTNISWRTTSGATLGGFTYEYDALGRRVSTTTLEGRTRHVYDNNWQVIADAVHSSKRL